MFVLLEANTNLEISQLSSWNKDTVSLMKMMSEL